MTEESAENMEEDEEGSGDEHTEARKEEDENTDDDATVRASQVKCKY